MIADIAHGHFDLADWSLLVAVVLFLVALVLDVMASHRPVEPASGRSPGRYTRPVALLALALVAFALLVL